MPTQLNPTKITDSKKLAEEIGNLALSKKAEDVISIDVSKVSSSTNYFIICSAETGLQVRAIANAVRKGTPNKPWHMEGMENENWVLLDYVDVVLHVFKTATREYYSLEKLWADAPITEIKDESEISN